jgi:hypothetical protein
MSQAGTNSANAMQMEPPTATLHTLEELSWVSTWVPLLDPPLTTENVHRFIEQLKMNDWSCIRKAQVVDALGSRLVLFVSFSTLHEATLFNKEKFFMEGQQMVFSMTENPRDWITKRQVRV